MPPTPGRSRRSPETARPIPLDGNPSDETVAALAKFFKVNSDYFFNDIYAAKIDHDLELLSQLQGYGLRRLSSRAFDLSQESQNLLTSMAEKLRASEGLPQVPPDATRS